MVNLSFNYSFMDIVKTKNVLTVNSIRSEERKVRILLYRSVLLLVRK